MSELHEQQVYMLSIQNEEDRPWVLRRSDNLTPALIPTARASVANPGVTDHASAL